jgi:hypothetical protein
MHTDAYWLHTGMRFHRGAWKPEYVPVVRADATLERRGLHSHAGESVKVFGKTAKNKATTETQRAQRFQPIENLFFFLCVSVVKRGCFSFFGGSQEYFHNLWSVGTIWKIGYTPPVVQALHCFGTEAL